MKQPNFKSFLPAEVTIADIRSVLDGQYMFERKIHEYEMIQKEFQIEAHKINRPYHDEQGERWLGWSMKTNNTTSLWN